MIKTKNIFSTTDYNKFKFLPFNRPLCKAALKELENSICIDDRLEIEPILVDKDYNVYDGQHRLTIAKKLKLPIYYIVEDSLKPTDLIRINTQRPFSFMDYLNFYCNQGYSEYLKLGAFMERFNLNISTVFSVLYSRGSKGNHFKKFYRGDFIFPEEKSLVKIIGVLIDYRYIVNSLKEKCFNVEESNYLKTHRFGAAIIEFLLREDVDSSLAKRKFISQFHFFGKRANKMEYSALLAKIYNYRTQSAKAVPIQFKEKGNEEEEEMLFG